LLDFSKIFLISLACLFSEVAFKKMWEGQLPKNGKFLILTQTI